MLAVQMRTGCKRHSSVIRRSSIGRSTGKHPRDGKRYDNNTHSKTITQNGLSDSGCGSDSSGLVASLIVDWFVLSLVWSQRYTIMNELVNFMAPTERENDGEYTNNLSLRGIYLVSPQYTSNAAVAWAISRACSERFCDCRERFRGRGFCGRDAAAGGQLVQVCLLMGSRIN